MQVQCPVQEGCRDKPTQMQKDENMRPSTVRYFRAFNSMEIRFHCPPVLQTSLSSALNSALKSLNALPGCVAYRLETRPHHRYCWRITGVWESDDAKQAHYSSAELQTLLTLLLTPALAEIRFCEAQAGCLSNALEFRATRMAG
jgi:quinol monooxygenase YgiN